MNFGYLYRFENCEWHSSWWFCWLGFLLAFGAPVKCSCRPSLDMELKTPEWKFSVAFICSSVLNAPRFKPSKFLIYKSKLMAYRSYETNELYKGVACLCGNNICLIDKALPTFFAQPSGANDLGVRDYMLIMRSSWHPKSLKMLFVPSTKMDKKQDLTGRWVRN